MAKKDRAEEPKSISKVRNEGMPRLVQRIESLKDFYNTYDDLDVTPQDREDFKKYLRSLNPQERKLLGTQRHFYVADFHNRGGLVMPILLQIEYEDGNKELMRIPAEIWRMDSRRVSKLLMTKKPIRSLLVDPNLETADADVQNNRFPRRVVKSRFQLFKKEVGKSPMKKGSRARAEKEDGENPEAMTATRQRVCEVMTAVYQARCLDRKMPLRRARPVRNAAGQKRRTARTPPNRLPPFRRAKTVAPRARHPELGKRRGVLVRTDGHRHRSSSR